MKNKINLTILSLLISASASAQTFSLTQDSVATKFKGAPTVAVDCAKTPNQKIPSPFENAINLYRGGTSGVGGGGDARKIRSLILGTKRQKLIESVKDAFSDTPQNAASTVRRLLAWYAGNRQPLTDEKAQTILLDMIAKGFGKDLQQTKFVMSESCIDYKGITKTAVAKMNQPRTDICINPARIVDDFGPYIQDSDLIGLMMHEFAHHYGHEDADHSFAAAIAMHYQLDNEERNQEGDPLNYLIK